MSDEELKALLGRGLSQGFTQPMAVGVSVKDDDPKCFLEHADWSSCFDDLPPEPEWTEPTLPAVPTSKFWQPRSLWTKTPIERLE